MRASDHNRPLLIGLALGVALLSGACTTRPGSTTVVRPVSELEWGPLNPARGDASPAAATLWGDRAGEVATGFLVRFVDGFASPPHVHNVAYRALVLEGLVHNDDPEAEPMWMSSGSFWTQPLGAAHITSASGGGALAYVEIDEGPYLVRPVEGAVADEQRPVNVHASNLVWLDFGMLGWRAEVPAQIAFLWGDPNTEAAHGVLLRLLAGSTATLGGEQSSVRAVVIEGRGAAGEEATRLDPGSYLSTDRGAVALSCTGELACMIYVRATGRFEAGVAKAGS